MWMNTAEIDHAAEILAQDPVMGPASKYLQDYKDLIDSVSDGWPYWRYGTKCADDLSALVEAAARAKRYGDWDYKAPAKAEVTKAIGKIKRFVNTCGQLKERGIKPPAETPFQGSLL